MIYNMLIQLFLVYCLFVCFIIQLFRFDFCNVCLCVQIYRLIFDWQNDFVAAVSIKTSTLT